MFIRLLSRCQQFCRQTNDVAKGVITNMSEIVDMCSRSKVLTLPFELNIDKWSTFSEDVKQIISTDWKNIKFLNDDGTGINDAITSVPDDSGGVYLFLLKPDVISNMHRYIMYIGRAQRKRNFSLRKRCVSYLKDTRPLVALIRELWGKQLYFFYLPIENDDIICKVEEELVRVIIPPCNSQIPYHYCDPDQPLF